MGRVREKYLVLNLPASSELDRDLKALCNFWFMVKAKGTAQGHHLRWNAYREEPRTPKTEIWKWSDIPQHSHLREIYEYLTEEKLAHLRGERDNSSQRVSASEASEMAEKARSEESTATRNELLTTIYRDTNLTQKELSSAVGLSRSRLADIVTN